MPDERTISLKAILAHVDFWRNRLALFNKAADILLNWSPVDNEYEPVIAYLHNEITYCKHILEQYDRLEVIRSDEWSRMERDVNNIDTDGGETT